MNTLDLDQNNMHSDQPTQLSIPSDQSTQLSIPSKQISIPSNKIDWNTWNFIDYLNVKSREITDIPYGVSISTMCATCKLNTKLNIPMIEKYLQLDPVDILSVKVDKNRLRTLLVVTSKPKRHKKNNQDITILPPVEPKNHFYNQITVVVRVDHGKVYDINTVPKINIKLFKNGSVQMSGCKSIKSINIALNKLIVKLKEIKAILQDKTINKITFIENPLTICVTDFKIDMINSNYQVVIQIDRDKLFNLLLKKKIKSLYEPCIRACVIIKYIPIYENPDMKEVSIFVFQKGNIIITGARCKNHIESAYDYINQIILTYGDEIIKKDEKREEKIIMDIYEDILKDIQIGLLKFN
jgi:TATA-box binding protein (TBP) (component of TFIID and TFIIIB)